MIRICINVDFDTDDPNEAYRSLHNILLMKFPDWDPDFEWESSDEWYDANGETIPENEISKIRLDNLA